MKNFLSAFRTNGVAFPFTKAKNRTAPGVYDGTQFIADLVDDLWGFYQAILKAANITPSGNVEAANATGSHELTSQAFQALHFLLGTNRTLNCWWDGTNWRYSAAAAPAIRIELNNNRILFYYAGNGALNGIIAWTTFFSLGFENNGFELLSNLTETGAVYTRQYAGSGFILKHDNTLHKVLFSIAPNGAAGTVAAISDTISVDAANGKTTIAELLIGLAAGFHGFGATTPRQITDWDAEVGRAMAFADGSAAANAPVVGTLIGLNMIYNINTNLQLAFRPALNRIYIRGQGSGTFTTWDELAKLGGGIFSGMVNFNGGVTLGANLNLAGFRFTDSGVIVLGSGVKRVSGVDSSHSLAAKTIVVPFTTGQQNPPAVAHAISSPMTNNILYGISAIVDYGSIGYSNSGLADYINGIAVSDTQVTVTLNNPVTNGGNVYVTLLYGI